VTSLPGFAALPDLASRALGGSVVAANDDLFAEKENLIKPSAPAFAAGQYGPRGKVYDGWETRRRREPGHDHAIVRLGVPGIVRGVAVDTSFFRGNYPPEVSVEAVGAAPAAAGSPGGAGGSGVPSPAELAEMSWQPLAERAPASGDTVNYYPVASDRRWTHVRLSIYPDGGVARLRVHGEPVPDPAYLDGTVDLAALESGGQLIDCSDAFFGSAVNLIMPGVARSMADGWENARRRDAGHDHVTLALAGIAVVRRVEIDTSYYVGNAPGSARLLAAAIESAGVAAPGVVLAGGAPSVPAGLAWRELLPRTRLQPDSRHRFLIRSAEPVTHVRLEVFPDGGVARLRVHGELTSDGMAALRERYQAALPSV
jgi:allantoicase